MERTSQISTWRAIIAMVLSILVMIIANLMALLIGNGIIALGVHEVIGNIIAAVLYPILTVLGVKPVCSGILKISLADCGITRCKIKPVWGICAILMPVIVIICYLFVPGHWESSVMNQSQIAGALSGAILFSGLAVGFVEEAIFRGIIMKIFEIRWNRKIAVIVPSVIFGLMHVIGVEMDAISIIQLIIAGSAVAILFSLVTYESGNIWSNALMHSVWNMCMGTGILYINHEMSENSIFNYVLETDSFFITGGDFGVDASVISIIVYFMFIILAILLKRKKLDELEFVCKGEHQK